MQTITATAKQLGVTRQYLGQLVKQLPAEQQPVQKGNSRLLGDEAIKSLQAMLTKPKPEPSNRTKADTEIIRTLREQLDHERQANDKLTELLGNEQQLHLIAEKRADELASRLKLIESTAQPQNDATESHESDSKTPHEEIHLSPSKPLKTPPTALQSVNSQQLSFWAKLWRWIKS